VSLETADELNSFDFLVVHAKVKQLQHERQKTIVSSILIVVAVI
jgi:hypothetical protein